MYQSSIVYNACFRLALVEHYRGFKVPDSGDFHRFHQWLEAVKKLECVSKTVVETERLIEFTANYADNTAQSEAAKAIRKGTVIP